MSAPGTLEVVGQTLGRILEPLGEAFESPESAREMLAELGLDLPDTFWARPATITAVGDAADAVTGLPDVLTALADAIAGEDVGAVVEAGIALAEVVRAVLVAVDAVASQVQDALTLVPTLNPADLATFAAELPERLLGHLAVTYLDGQHRAVLGALYLLGFVDRTVERPDSTDPNRPATFRHELRLDRLPDLFSDPSRLLSDVYGWGGADLDAERVMFGLERLLDAVGIFAVIDRTGPDPVVQTILADIRRGTADPNPIEAVFAFGTGAGLDRTLDLGGGWSVSITIAASLDAGAVLTIAPPLQISAAPTALPVQGAAGVEFIRSNGPGGDPVIILGLAGGPRLEADAISARFAADLTWDMVSGTAHAALEVVAAFVGGRVVITLDGADAFIVGLLGDGLVMAAELEAGWSLAEGIFFVGGVGVEIDVPVDLRLGGVTISTLHLALGVTDGRLQLEASGAIGARIGPFAVAVERMGITADLSFPQSGGNLEVANLALDLKPPSGLGFVLDAGVVKGGGYLYFAPERHEYAGVLELALGPISIKAIGILTTELPGGEDGWALLLLVFTEFSAIQLGFGFTLNGVGGMVGLQHGVSTEALQSGLRTGILDSVLFPVDPVVRAPQILGDLRAVFPITPGALTIGPVLKLGWSTPPLITITVGLILQFDDVLNAPGATPQLTRIVLLGQLKVQVPPDLGAGTPELLKLVVDIIGSYETREKTLAIDAALRDSHVAGLPITGTLTVRATLGATPSFLMAVGGFHPRFTDLPPGVPEQTRVGIQLQYDIVTVRLVGYTAVTSNTFQIGAEASLVAAAAGFRVEAFLGFDALFLFQPTFHFEIEFRVGASIRYHSISLASISVRGTISGPGHWLVTGHASISLLFLDVDIDVEVEWGTAPATPLPSVEVRPQIIAALEKPENWLTQLPVGGEGLVTLAQSSTEALLAHPLGELSVTQRVVPLATTITRLGTSRPSDGTRFDISAVTIGAGAAQTPRTRTEHFARGEFLDLSEEQKLSTPSFEQFPAGVSVSSDDYRVGGGQVAFEPEMETLYLNEPEARFLQVVPAAMALALAGRGAAGASALRAGKRLIPPDAVQLSLSDAAYLVADARTPNVALRPETFTYTAASMAVASVGKAALIAEVAEVEAP